MNTSSLSPVSAAQDEATSRRFGWFMFVFGMAILALSTLSSCNTARGFGRDVEHVGNRIERAASGH